MTENHESRRIQSWGCLGNPDSCNGGWALQHLPGTSQQVLMCALHFMGILWTGNGAGESSSFFVEEDASFEGRIGNPDLKSTNTGTGKFGLKSEAANELLSPQPHQAMGL